MKEKNILKEALNEAYVEGLLLEKKSEIKEYKNKKGESKKALAGYIILKVGENSKIRMGFFVNTTTSKGEVSKLYTNLLDALNSATALADIEEGDNETLPSKLVARGKLGLDDAYDKKTEKVKSYDSIDLKFLNEYIPNEDKPFSPKAEFEIEAYINKITEEKKKNKDGDMEETGRLAVQFLIPLYGGIVIPKTIFIKKKSAEIFTGSRGEKDTIKLKGNIISTYTTKKEIRSEFEGEEIEDIVTTVKKELVARGFTAPYPEAKVFDPELIKTSLKERMAFLEEKEREGKSGTGTSKKPPKSKAKEEMEFDYVEDEDTPPKAAAASTDAFDMEDEDELPF